MTSADLKQLHPHDVPLWLAVETATWRLACAAKLPLERIRPVPKRELIRTAGCCYHGSREIQVGLRRSWTKKDGWSPRFQQYYLLDTIMHEVAHLAAGHEASHGEQWVREFARMMVLAEDINIRVDLINSGAKLKP